MLPAIHSSMGRAGRWWCCLLLCLFVPGILSSRVVTLKSIQIFQTHSMLPFKPSIYFLCNGENSVALPDVTSITSLFTFNGEESWQPLTELPTEKCKRCGVYESDPIKSDVFDEWELCPEDFVNGENVHFKENEVNATFRCPECGSSNSSKVSDSKSGNTNGEKSHLVLVIVICTVISGLLGTGLVAGYKYWQKRKREHDHARFLKIFEDGDDIEDELGLGRII